MDFPAGETSPLAKMRRNLRDGNLVRSGQTGSCALFRSSSQPFRCFGGRMIEWMALAGGTRTG